MSNIANIFRTVSKADGLESFEGFWIDNLAKRHDLVVTERDKKHVVANIAGGGVMTLGPDASGTRVGIVQFAGAEPIRVRSIVRTSAKGNVHIFVHETNVDADKEIRNVDSF